MIGIAYAAALAAGSLTVIEGVKYICKKCLERMSDCDTALHSGTEEGV